MPVASRLLQLNSAHSSSIGLPGGSTTNFVCQLGNQSRVLQHAIGISVESVVFHNLLPNVRSTQNTLPYAVDGVVQPTNSIPGDTWYTLDTFAAALLNICGAAVTFSVAVGVGTDGGDRLVMTNVSPATITIFATPNSLSYHIGFPFDDLVLAPYTSVTTRVNLQGEMAVQVHSKTLVGSATAIDGDGGATNALVTIPLSAEYGMMQTHHINGDNMPQVFFTRDSRPELFEIETNLRYMDGALAFTDNGPMFITYRVWFRV